MKRIESLFKIVGMKFEFGNLEIRFHKRQVSLLVVKTVKCKREYLTIFKKSTITICVRSVIVYTFWKIFHSIVLINCANIYVLLILLTCFRDK